MKIAFADLKLCSILLRKDKGEGVPFRSILKTYEHTFTTKGFSNRKSLYDYLKRRIIHLRKQGLTERLGNYRNARWKLTTQGIVFLIKLKAELLTILKEI